MQPSEASSSRGSPTLAILPGRLLLGWAIVLIAFNLRPALSSFAPVVNEVMAETGLSASGASLMSTAPVLCLGLFAATAPGLSRRLGVERAALVAVAAVAAGCAARGLGGVAALVAGSLLAGAGIGIANVLLPSLLKRDFADRAPLMTGLYSMALCIGAAVGAGATAPLRDGSGSWQFALAFWSLPAFAALGFSALAWSHRLRAGVSTAPRQAGRSLWRDPLAWQVTLFMGLQSMLAYSVFGWLAPIMRDRGDSAVTAGLVVSVSVLSQVAASLPAPILAARMRRQSLPAGASMLGVVIGFLGLALAPLVLQWAFAVLLGLGMGGAFATAVLFMVLRAPTGAAAARLSSMAQSVGYCLGSLGPLIVGVAHDASGDWHGAMTLFVVAGGAAVVAGLLAGRNRHVRG